MNSIKPEINGSLGIPMDMDRFNKKVSALKDLKTSITCCVSPKYWNSQRRLLLYKNKHAGDRCFIIGNGPSLRSMDLSALKSEKTFGLNRIYLLFDYLGFETTYFVSFNRYVIKQCSEEILKIRCPKFIAWYSRNLIPFTKEMMFVRSRNYPKFHTDITKGIWGGSTVTNVALQIAYYMGFQQVILIGVDHSFHTKGKPHQVVVSEGEDPNHFHPNYFGKGFQWQLPDLDDSERAYKMAKNQFESNGREILDATVKGKLQVFPKVCFEKIIKMPKNFPLKKAPFPNLKTKN